MQEDDAHTPLEMIAPNDATHPATLPKIDFAKRPIPVEAVFFAHPSRIGTLLAAHSDWLPSKARPIRDRILSIVPALAAGFLGGVIVKALLLPTSFLLTALCYAIPVALAIGASFLVGRRYYSNFYIGSEGFAVYERRTNKTELFTAHEVRWDEISGMSSHVQEIYYRGDFKGYQHQYVWYDRSGKNVVFRLKMMQRPKETGLDTPAQIMFSQVCELQWTQRLLKQLEHQLATDGFVAFGYVADLDATTDHGILVYRDKVIFRSAQGEHTYHFDDVARLYWTSVLDGKPKKKIDKVGFFVERAESYGLSVSGLRNAGYFRAALGVVLNTRFPNA